jgi:hypothetical protein
MMHVVRPGKYFSSVEENKMMNQFFKNYPPGVKDTARHTHYNDYFKEKYNGTYFPGENFNDLGHFMFEDEVDSIMFALRWG